MRVAAIKALRHSNPSKQLIISELYRGGVINESQDAKAGTVWKS